MTESQGPTKTPSPPALSATALSEALQALGQRARDPGFTPRVRDVDALVDLLAVDDYAKAAERAIARVGAPALTTLRARFERAEPRLRAQIVRAIGRLLEAGRSGPAIATLLAALTDADPKTRRNAAIALGHVPAHVPAPAPAGTPGEGSREPEGSAEDAAKVEAALLSAWHADPRPEMRRSIAASLGKVGSAASFSLLREATAAEDPELGRIAARASMMVERTQSRGERGRIDGAASPPGPIDLVVFSRRGLEELLAGELSRVAAVRDVRVDGIGRVVACLTGSLDALFTARTMLEFRFPLPSEALGEGESPAAAVARAMTSDPARVIFQRFTVGPVRYRIAWVDGGHRRATTWETARAIAERAPDLVNDPTSSIWELVVSERPGFVDLAVSPRALPDPRFAWRVRDVPAASHPTIAAALVRVAGARADDVVWDPFVGSGAELVERALLGPYRALLGSDVDARALAAARENLARARIEARLEAVDALEARPDGVTLIVTNPPMGRRAVRNSGLAALLDRFVTHAASVLKPAGRLVWITPWPSRARTAGTRAGLALDWARRIDMGGFDAEMQRWVKPGDVTR